MPKKMMTCPKCQGRGRFEHFAHTWEGKCFECAGHGRVESLSLDARKVIALQAASDLESLSEFIRECRANGDAAATCNVTWQEWIAERAAKSLFDLHDKAAALALLNNAAARYNGAGRRAAELVIAAGRKLAAARAA